MHHADNQKAIFQSLGSLRHNTSCRAVRGCRKPCDVTVQGRGLQASNEQRDLDMQVMSTHRADGRSILLTTTMTFLSRSRALRRTKRVWGMGPSTASTNSSTPDHQQGNNHFAIEQTCRRRAVQDLRCKSSHWQHDNQLEARSNVRVRCGRTQHMLLICCALNVMPSQETLPHEMHMTAH